MMRSLWTAASGMTAQQTNIDTISNNLANVNTTGYKKETVEFKSLMYQTMQGKSTDSQGNTKPVGIQVGLGVRPGAITSNFTQGALNASGGDYDYGIQGNGFFMVQKADGSVGYTRNGDFSLSITENGRVLTNSLGYPVLDSKGNPIVLDASVDVTNLTIDQYGNLMTPDANNVNQPIGIQIGLATFPNAAGLDKTSDSILDESDASGVPTIYTANQLGSVIKSGYLEASNVEAVDEMVNMIIAQRAYEMNSKAITASDEMLQTANGLFR